MPIEITSEIKNGCAANNRIYQNQLYKLVFPFLIRICFRYAKNKEDAVSLLNMGFLKIIQNLSKYQVNMPAEPWLSTVMIHSIIDDLRKNTNHKMHIVVSDEMEKFNQHAFDDIISHSHDQSLSDNMLMALSTVPEMSRKIFNLFVVDEYSHKEIGQMLGINETASRWHVHNAKKILFENLKSRYSNNETIIAK